MSKEKIVLNINDLSRLRDYLHWMNINYETLRNEILHILQSREIIAISEKIDELCIVFLENKDCTTLKEIQQFIESIDIDSISLDQHLSSSIKEKK